MVCGFTAQRSQGFGVWVSELKGFGFSGLTA